MLHTLYSHVHARLYACVARDGVPLSRDLFREGGDMRERNPSVYREENVLNFNK